MGGGVINFKAVTEYKRVHILYAQCSAISANVSVVELNVLAFMSTKVFFFLFYHILAVSKA